MTYEELNQHAIDAVCRDAIGWALDGSTEQVAIYDHELRALSSSPRTRVADLIGARHSAVVVAEAMSELAAHPQSRWFVAFAGPIVIWRVVACEVVDDTPIGPSITRGVLS